MNRKFLMLVVSAAFIVISCKEGASTSTGSTGPGQAASCDQEGRPTVALRVVESGGDNAVEVGLDFCGNTTSTQPRVAEITLQLSHGLTYRSFLAGDAVEASEKVAVAQIQSGNKIRIVVYSSQNLNAIEFGNLGTLRLTRTDSAPQSIEILTDKPLFAPAAANQGLLVGDPIEF